MKADLKFFRIAVSWVGVLLWCITLWILSSIPGGKLPEVHVPNADKIVHFGYFMVGAALLANAFHQSTTLSGRKLFLVVVATVMLVGAADEIHQLFTPNRSGSDFGDWLADTTGGITGALIVGWFYGRRRK